MNSSDPSTRGAGFLFLSHPTKHNFVDHNRQGQRSWIIADICDQCLTSKQDCSVNTRHNLSLKLHTDCISAIYTRCKSVTCALAHFVWSCSKLYTKGKKNIFHYFPEALGRRWELDPLRAIFGAASSISHANKFSLECWLKKVNPACVGNGSWCMYNM